jgi:thiol-disulfide isomerase/thioredoxin
MTINVASCVPNTFIRILTNYRHMKLTKFELKQIIKEELKQVLNEANGDADPFRLIAEFLKKLRKSKPATRTEKQNRLATINHLTGILEALKAAETEEAQANLERFCPKFKQLAHDKSKKLLKYVKTIHSATGGKTYELDERADLWAVPITPDYVDDMVKRIYQATAPFIGPNGEKLFPCGYAVDDSKPQAPRKKPKIYKYGHELSRKQWNEISSNAVIINYHSPWCGPCKTLWEILPEVASEYGLPIVKVDITAEKPEWHRGEMPSSVPKVVLLKSGRETVWKTITGSKYTLVQRLRDFLDQNN